MISKKLLLSYFNNNLKSEGESRNLEIIECNVNLGQVFRITFKDLIIHYLCTNGPVEPADVTGVAHVSVDPGRDQLVVGLLRTLDDMTKALAGVKHRQLT